MKSEKIINLFSPGVKALTTSLAILTYLWRKIIGVEKAI
jgi:hypothetical protein